MTTLNRYSRIIEDVFLAHYTGKTKEFTFEREELERCAAKLGIKLPKNLGDLIYSFRYRIPLPDKVKATAPADHEWAILPSGKALYRFALRRVLRIEPSTALAPTKVAEGTPGVIDMYALGDEQALLAKVRYNRLLDVFTRLACYSLQNHLRTFVPGLGQVETDEIYIGVARSGAHYVLPVQAKGGRDKISVVQIEQDVAVCRHKFPNLICRPIAAQFMEDATICLFEFCERKSGLLVETEKHYQLVPPSELTPENLADYRRLEET